MENPRRHMIDKPEYIYIFYKHASYFRSHSRIDTELNEDNVFRLADISKHVSAHMISKILKSSFKHPSLTSIGYCVKSEHRTIDEDNICNKIKNDIPVTLKYINNTHVYIEEYDIVVNISKDSMVEIFKQSTIDKNNHFVKKFFICFDRNSLVFVHKLAKTKDGIYSFDDLVDLEYVVIKGKKMTYLGKYSISDTRCTYDIFKNKRSGEYRLFIKKFEVDDETYKYVFYHNCKIYMFDKDIKMRRLHMIDSEIDKSSCVQNSISTKENMLRRTSCSVLNIHCFYRYRSLVLFNEYYLMRKYFTDASLGEFDRDLYLEELRKSLGIHNNSIKSKITLKDDFVYEQICNGDTI